MRGFVLRKDEPAAIEKSTEPLIKHVAKTLGEGKTPSERTEIKTQVGSKEAEGVRLRSSGKSRRTGSDLGAIGFTADKHGPGQIRSR